MKKLVLALLSTLTLSGQAFACQPASPNEYKALIMATGLNQPILMQQLTTKYCYNLTSYNFEQAHLTHPVFFSPSPIFMNYYLRFGEALLNYRDNRDKDNADPNVPNGMDILSFFLTMPYTSFYQETPQERAQEINFLKAYDPKANVSWYDNPVQTLENNPQKYKDPLIASNRTSQIRQLLVLYKGMIDLPKDKYGNDAAIYAMMTYEAEAFSALTRNSLYNYYRKNSDNLTIFHMAFANKYFTGTPEQASKNLERINTILVDAFKPEKVNELKFRGVSFNGYMEAMKDNNQDLYDRIVQKQKTAGLYPKNIESGESVKKANYKFYIDTMDYMVKYRGE